MPLFKNVFEACESEACGSEACESEFRGAETCECEARLYPPVHEKTPLTFSFDRIEMLWERYPQYHEMAAFSTLDALMQDHESWQKDFEDLRKEYEENQYDRFLVQLSWADLPYSLQFAGYFEILHCGCALPPEGASLLCVPPLKAHRRLRLVHIRK